MKSKSRVADYIYHIATTAAWQEAQAAGAYRHASLEQEGFIHCSEQQQVLWVANAFFSQQTDLYLLTIATQQLNADLRYELGIGTTQEFPHIYGAIELNAVVAATPWQPAADGKFYQLPI